MDAMSAQDAATIVTSKNVMERRKNEVIRMPVLAYIEQVLRSQLAFCTH